VGAIPIPRKPTLQLFLDRYCHPIDQGLVLFFPSPASYTGEDVVELHGHGGPVVLDLLIERVVALGARLAQPGEFSKRAFLNGKFDLAQAEAVADLIESRTRLAARSALRSLAGEFSKEIDHISQRIGDLRVYIEADIDFSDEGIEVLASTDAGDRLNSAKGALNDLLGRACQGALLARGARVVLAGAPNVGKSSLMNALSGADRSIISEEPGTTRDLVETEIEIDGLPVHLTDTAGLRESDNAIESEGVRRAHTAMATADLVLLLIDDMPNSGQAGQMEIGEALDGVSCLRVYNKCDLSHRAFGLVQGSNMPGIAISATQGGGIIELLQAIKRELGFTDLGESLVMARRRHLEALKQTQGHLEAASCHIGLAPELLAEELRLAQLVLGEITGEVTTEDLLGRVFSSFCIGK
jgi:tRNA modification GTPase